MERRSLRPWWLALGVSLLLHVSLFGGLDWVIPQWKPPSPALPLEVQLAAVSKPVDRTCPGYATPPPC